MREQEGALWIDYDAVKEEVWNLRKIIADLETNRQGFLNMISAVGQSWQSSSAESFIQAAGEEAAGLAQETERLLGIAEWFDETADNVKAAIDDAKRRHTERN